MEEYLLYFDLKMDKNKKALIIGIGIVNLIGLLVTIYIISFSGLFIKNNEKIIDKSKDIKLNNIYGTLNIDKFKNNINNNYILIDVRTPGEISQGYIEGTDLFLDFYSNNFKFSLLKLDNTKKYLIYCAHGNRSRVVLNVMRQMNFKEVYDLEGGIVNWINVGEKIIKR